MTFAFQKASKRQRKARIGLIGPSGSGKTYTALRIARGLGKRIALIDTENESASLYADEFDFDSLNLDTFAPEVYVQAIKAAESAGYDVLIIDSLSHAWAGKDGALEQVDRVAKRMQTSNTFAAWREVTPMHNALVDALVRCKCHLIVTMRAKTEYVVEKDEKTGKTMPRKVGLAPIQRDGLEYEFDIVADMDLDNHFIVSKTRYKPLAGQVIHKPGEELGKQIKAWLESGSAPESPVPVIAFSVQSENRNGHTESSSAVTANDGNLATDKQRKMLFAMARKAGLSDEQIKFLIETETGKTSTKDLTKSEASDLIEFLQHATPDALQEALAMGPTDDVPTEEEYLQAQEEAARAVMAAGSER